MTKQIEVTKEECLKALQPEMDLILNQDKRPFAVINEGDRHTVVPVPSKQFLERIRLILSKKLKFMPGTGLLKELQEYATAVGRHQSPQKNVFIRYRRGLDKVMIDMADQRGRTVMITINGIKIIENPKTLFYHPSGQEALEEYQDTEIIKGFKKLKKYLGKISQDEFKIIICWLVAVIYTDGPYPILLMQGEQGSAKTFAMKILRSLIDPAQSPIRSLPSSERDFIITANNSVVLPFDNVSYLRPWMPDAFCRVASGGGYSSRKLYTDDEEMVFNICRPFILNGIPDFVTKNDMADRVILIQMGSIPKKDRKTEKELMASFGVDKPEILGALYQAVSIAMANIGDVIIEELPRMADFAKVACAVAPALKWTQEEFLVAYQDNINQMSGTCLEADIFATAVLEFITKENEWEGSATDLLGELNVVNAERAKKKYWPSSVSSLSSRLRIAAPALRGKGVDILHSRTNNKRIIQLKLNE